MVDSERAGTGASATPPKVIGLGAPISVWIYFEVSEIPALIDALRDELARHGVSAPIDRSAVDPETGVDAAHGRSHVGELQRMLGDVERAAATRAHGRFDVLWPTVLAHGVVREAVTRAERRASAAAGCDAASAQEAFTAAQRTVREFKAIDDGGLRDVWL